MTRSCAPHGARGLKQSETGQAEMIPRLRPARGAWIETASHSKINREISVAPRTGRVD